MSTHTSLRASSSPGERNAWFDNIDTCRTTICVGSPGSGKTFFCLAFIHHHLKKGTFGHIFGIIPSYSSEQHSSYAYLRCFPKQVTICEQWDPAFLDMIIDRQLKTAKAVYGAKTPEAREKAIAKHEKVVLFIDDCSDFGDEMTRHPSFISIVTKSRHLNIHNFLCIHSFKSVMRPVVRGNAAALVIGRIVNGIIHETIYQEFLSASDRWKDFKDFRQWCNDNVSYGQHNLLCCNNLTGDTVESKDLSFVSDFVKAQPSLEKAFWAFMKTASEKKKSAGERRHEPTLKPLKLVSGITMPDLTLRR